MSETDFLFARPSFLEGMARILDWSGSLNIYNDSIDGMIADRRALANDFRIVGRDIQEAINKYEQKEKKVLPIDD